jgi:hypothetical protein
MSDKVPRLTKLSAEHLAILSETREKWRHVPEATGPADREQAEAGVADAYRLAGLPEPGRIEWADSPMAATIAMTRHQEDGVSREVQAVGGWPEWRDLWETTWWQISEEVKTPLRTGERLGEVIKDEVYELLTTTRWKDLGLPKKAHRPSEVGMLQDGAILGQHDVARRRTDGTACRAVPRRVRPAAQRARARGGLPGRVRGARVEGHPGARARHHRPGHRRPMAGRAARPGAADHR